MADDREGVPRWLWLGMLFLAAMLLSGCGSSASDPVTAPNNVDPAAIREILNWFVANRGLNWRRATGRDRDFEEHRGFFVSRRAWRLLGWGPAAWSTEPGYVTVRNRIDNELPQVAAFATAKLGAPGTRGPLMGGTDPVTPPHLDLADVARQRPRHPATTMADASRRSNFTQQTAYRYLTERRARAMSIIWRAAAIHHQLWDDTTDRLREPALAEILDRRLHMVERMSYQIGSAGDTGAGSVNTSAGPRGPWPDGSRVRIFEYPRIHASVAGSGVGPVAPYNAGQLPNPPPSGAPLWRYEAPSRRRIVWNVFPGHRLRDPADPGFDPFDAPNFPGYFERLRDSAGLTSAQAMDQLYQQSTDWWQRSWLYCDHVIASLHLTSLLLGTRRRYHSDTRFNDAVRDQPPALLGPMIAVASGASGPGRLMSSTSDPVFENSLVAPQDLQVGDHVIFWNNPLYPLVETGEWQLENALVMGVRSDPETHSIRQRELLLQGHGTGVKTPGQYADALRAFMNPAMNETRAVARAVPTGQDTAYISHTYAHLVRWSPYGDPWSGPGPWWVIVPARFASTAEQLRNALRKGIIDAPEYPVRPPQPNRGPNAPPIAAYFPLWEPHYPGGWAGYLAARRSGPVRVRRSLEPVRIDRDTIPGLHYVGDEWSALPVVRPRVTP